MARRCLWDAISAKLREGFSMVLTSHSMEECEALCQRLVIMVNGQICCMGSPLQLKNKFGNGYTVLIRISQDEKISSNHYHRARAVPMIVVHELDSFRRPNSTKQRLKNEKIIKKHIKKVNDFMSSTFPTSVLKAVHNTLLHYCIEDCDKKILCSEIFEQIEEFKEALSIEDYTVCQTNLEQIFLTFARMQKNDVDEGSLELQNSANDNNNQPSTSSSSSSSFSSGSTAASSDSSVASVESFI